MKVPAPNVSRDFLVAYVLLSVLRSLPRLNSKAAAVKTIIKVLVRQGKNPQVFKQAIFAVTLPRTYALWSRRYPNSVLPAVLSSPLLHLIERSFRRTIAVYVATAAAVNFRRGSKQRQILPPTWTLILAANSWLLWAFLFQRKCFPRGYGDLILRHSGYGSGEPVERLVEFLGQTKFECHPPGVLSSSQPPESPEIQPAHTRVVCARLHPGTTSCTETYIRAWLTQFPKVFTWVSAFGTLSLLFKRRKIRESPLNVFKDWFVSSIRGTAFVVGSINTCWGLTCLFQRILRPGSIPHVRWIANGLLGNLWVLVLPASRRTDFALYCTRLAIVSCWDLCNQWSPKYAEALVLALSWSSLYCDRRVERGPRGMAGMVMDYIDAHTYRQA
ncbi:hypothetical protein JB92DRAFT_2986889 [Gautieria morchelliformis]|nr:hypothetical protein JB92DRAFT_2986889 [Gautieria morchelliformis]